MELYIIRHGQTDWNKARMMQGQTDIPLNENGIAMAQKAAEELSGIVFDRIFSSPLQRARQTAEILAAGRGVLVELDDRLKEMSFGVREGSNMDAVCSDPADPMYAFFKDPEHYIAPEQGESFAQLYERREAFIREKIMPLENSCRRVLIVAHGAMNHSLINPVKKIPLKDFWYVWMGNCEAVKLELKNGILFDPEEKNGESRAV